MVPFHHHDAPRRASSSPATDAPVVSTKAHVHENDTTTTTINDNNDNDGTASASASSSFSVGDIRRCRARHETHGGRTGDASDHHWSLGDPLWVHHPGILSNYRVQFSIVHANPEEVE